QRQLAGQVINVITHRLGDDRAHALLHGLGGGVPAHGLEVEGEVGQLRRWFRQLRLDRFGGDTEARGGGDTLGDQGGGARGDLVHRHAQTTEVACDHRGDLTARGQHVALVDSHQGGPRQHGVGSGLHDRDGGRSQLCDGGEGDIVIRQGYAGARQVAAGTAARTGRGPETLVLPGDRRRVDDLALTVELAEVHRG